MDINEYYFMQKKYCFISTYYIYSAHWNNNKKRWFFLIIFNASTWLSTHLFAKLSTRDCLSYILCSVHRTLLNLRWPGGQRGKVKFKCPKFYLSTADIGLIRISIKREITLRTE